MSRASLALLASVARDGPLVLEQIPFASERERVKMLVKTKSWSRFREPMRAEAALEQYRPDWKSRSDFRPMKLLVKYALERFQSG